ncbi:MAG TPA: rhodanese-like domain-containing protein [Noviherbaspirillum sp.]|nr:rhodanese-like domain-containing protein [Noviherbaspirillum sp.]
MADYIVLELIKSEGLAHLSYLVGNGTQAAVIDPRRDCETYISIAQSQGMQITHIFETHRNEDYVVGSVALQQRTGAKIYHGKALDFSYGNPLSEGDSFEFGSVILKVLETPGHTPESISLVLIDKSASDNPLAVFTGDLLFIGAVGRTDLFPERAREMAGLQYDSIFSKVLPLGDHVLLYPGHGAGSVCGSGMAKREFSTLGYERLYNQALQKKDRNSFIEMKLAEKPHRPPYFRKMEEYNQQGNAPVLPQLPTPSPMSAEQFKAARANGMLVLDVRSTEAIAGAFIPDSLALPNDLIPAYGGYFLSYDRDIGLVAEGQQQVETAVLHLMRLGYDRVKGFLAGGMRSWETSGEQYDQIPAVHVDKLVERIRAGADFILLDVRKEEELEKSGKLPGALHIFLGDLLEHIDEIPKDKTITTFCGSGQRALVAASLLKQNGFKTVEDSLGAMEACQAAGCPLEQVETAS